MAVHDKGRLHPKDLERANRLKDRLQAATQSEAIRRAMIFAEVILEFQEGGGEVILCKPNMPEKVVWFV